MPRRIKPGVFCIESDWTSDLRDRLSARPLLEFLEQAQLVQFMHRRVSTPEDLCRILRQWTQRKYAAYPMAYLALHGVEGHVEVGRRSLELADLAESLQGRCVGKTLYFGSCSTFNIAKADIESFRKTTKAKCVAGYTQDVDWIEAAAFELLLMDCFAYYKRSDAILNYLKKNHGTLVRRLGFRMYYG